MSTKIKYNDEILETLSGGEYVTLHTKGYLMEDDVRVEVAGENPILQEKTITKNGLYTPDEGYDGLSKVTVDVPVGVFPSGIKTITANGTHNVSGYAKAEVNVLSESGIALPNVQPMFLVKDIAFITPAITTAKVSVTLDDISNFVITEGE